MEKNVFFQKIVTNIEIKRENWIKLMGSGLATPKLNGGTYYTFTFSNKMVTGCLRQRLDSNIDSATSNNTYLIFRGYGMGSSW